MQAVFNHQIESITTFYIYPRISKCMFVYSFGRPLLLVIGPLLGDDAVLSKAIVYDVFEDNRS
jgi:hypothetical protein